MATKPGKQSKTTRHSGVKRFYPVELVYTTNIHKKDITPQSVFAQYTVFIGLLQGRD